MTNYKTLRALCDAATDGPWYVMEDGFGRSKPKAPTVYATNQDLNYICECRDFANTGQTLNLENARFIAATDPQTVRALIDEVEKLRSLLDGILNWETTEDQIREALKGTGHE